MSQSQTALPSNAAFDAMFEVGGGYRKLSAINQTVAECSLRKGDGNSTHRVEIKLQFPSLLKAIDVDQVAEKSRMTFYKNFFVIERDPSKFGKLTKQIDDLVFTGTLQQKLHCIIQVIQDMVECISLILAGKVECKDPDGNYTSALSINDATEYAIWFREIGSTIRLTQKEDKYNQWITWLSCCSLIHSPQFMSDNKYELIIFDSASKKLRKVDQHYDNNRT